MALPMSLLRYFGLKPLLNVAECVVDNVFRDKVVPKVGSVVFCDPSIRLR